MQGYSEDLCLQVLAAQPVLPLPGKGQTLERWRALAALAAQDMAACKLAEAHWDAQVILQDLNQSSLCAMPQVWAVWASENPKAPLQVLQSAQGSVLHGKKMWCSGAHLATHALLTCHDAQDNNHLAVLELGHESIHIHDGEWQALGMRHVKTSELTFKHTPVSIVAPRSDYLKRPGFWHGGAGIAACWFGAACAIAQLLRHQLQTNQPHAAAHLGAMFTQLRAARAMFHDLAQRIDASPEQPWVEEVMALRSFVRQLASTIIERSARAMGPGPLCSNVAHAQRCADLAIWCTQQHAEKDDESLGRMSQAAAIEWEL